MPRLDARLRLLETTGRPAPPPGVAIVRTGETAAAAIARARTDPALADRALIVVPEKEPLR